MKPLLLLWLLALPCFAFGQNWQPILPGYTYLHKTADTTQTPSYNYVAADSASANGDTVYLARDYRFVEIDTIYPYGYPVAANRYRLERRNVFGTRCYAAPHGWVYEIGDLSIPVQSHTPLAGTLFAQGSTRLQFIGKEAQTVLGQADSVQTWQRWDTAYPTQRYPYVFAKKGGLLEVSPIYDFYIGVYLPFGNSYWGDGESRRIYARLAPGQPNPFPMSASDWVTAAPGSTITLKTVHGDDIDGPSIRWAKRITVDSIYRSADSVALHGHGIEGTQFLQPFWLASGPRGPEIPREQARLDTFLYTGYTFAVQNAPNARVNGFNAPILLSGSFSLGGTINIPASSYSLDGSGRWTRTYVPLLGGFDSTYSQLLLYFIDYEGGASFTFRQGPGIGLTDSYSMSTNTFNTTESLCFDQGPSSDTCPLITAILTQVESKIDQTPLQVSPNPFTSTLDVTAENPANYRILDARGATVLEGGLTEGLSRLSMEPLPAGLYQLTTQGRDGRTSSLRIVKME